MKALGTNEVNEIYKSQVYNTCIVNLFYVRTEKTVILSKPLQIQQPASMVFNYCIR